jgi:CRISPR-associated protein Cst1
MIFVRLAKLIKKSFDFSNAITNILGFNTDNSNWIWAFKDGHSKICPVCALIYTCAFLSFAFVLKQGKKKNTYLNCFYFLNQNNNVKGSFDPRSASTLKYQILMTSRLFLS